MSRLILASRSPRRKALLAQAGLSPEVVPTEVDETPRPGESPRRYVRRLAIEKARRAAASVRPGDPALVLGADTIVVLDGATLGKPSNREEARRMLSRLSGRMHEVLTGYAVLPVNRPGGKRAAGRIGKGIAASVVATKVEFKTLREDEIEAYIATGEPFDKAGAYAIQGAGAFMVRRIRGSHSNVIGLPVCEVIETLRALDGSLRAGESNGNTAAG